MKHHNIIHSPETPMPEPYKSYIGQRAEAIKQIIEPVVGDSSTQLCSRAITKDEVAFDDGIVYGCVVTTPEDGLKTILYQDNNANTGKLVHDFSGAYTYLEHTLENGQRIRLKDPRESDGAGQFTIGSVDELDNAISSLQGIPSSGLIVMPHMQTIVDRYAFGEINLSDHGSFDYVGREYVLDHEGRETFGGGDIAVTRRGDLRAQREAHQALAIPPRVYELARRALSLTGPKMLHAGRFSVDILDGIADNGHRFVETSDFTPRVGGHTPAEVLAIDALKRTSSRLAMASTRLQYNPSGGTRTGVAFVDTPTLLATAEVTDVKGAYRAA